MKQPAFVFYGRLQDPDLKMVRQWLADGRPPDKLAVKGLSRVGRVYAGMYGNLSLKEQGVIRLSLRSVPAGYPFQRIHIDLVGPLNKGA